MPRLLPPDFLINMQTLLGDAWEDYLQSLEMVEQTSIRLHPFKKNHEISGTPIQWEPTGVLLKERPTFALDPNWHAGVYYVQESSSMFLGEVMRQLNLGKSPLKALDLCAAPGGKSTHLLSLLHPESLLVSNEILPKRNKILTENIERWGMPNVVVTQNEASDFKRIPDFFDVMLIDAPCSGEGLFRRQPEAVNEWSLENIQHCSIRQQTILKDISPALKTGGYLIYSTCTFNVQENEAIVQSLLDSGNWKLIPLKNNFPELISEGCIKGTFHFYPHKVPGSGFFIAVLQKTNAVSVISDQRYWPSSFSEVKTFPDNLKSFLLSTLELKLFSRKEQLWLIPSKLAKEVLLLDNVLKITHSGIAAGSMTKNLFTPAHGLAMSLILNENIIKIELNKTEAIAFLRKETIFKDGFPNGWALACYQENPLGWIKVIPNRFNNHLPIPLMLRLK